MFTTNPKTHGFILNYESDASLPDDEALFDGLTNIITANIHDHTDAGTTYDQVQLLNGAANGVVGSVLTIPVGPGDKVSAEVYAKYLAPTGTNNPVAAIGNLVLGAITGSTGANSYEGTINSGYGSSGTVANLINSNASSSEPMAFINLLFLPDDATNTIESSHFAFKQITSASSNNQALLALDQPYEAPESGYVVVYLSNESAQLTEVYFDDLKVTVEEHPVIETSDFYPFGMQTAGGFQRITAKENRYKFNQGTGDKKFKTERITALGLNLDMTKLRMYDYQLGRFTSIDPLADEVGQEVYTPYQYGYNDPINNSDPYGDCPACFGGVIGGLVDYGLQVAVNLAEGDGLGKALTDVDVKSIVVSAAAGAVSGGLSTVSKIKNGTKLLKAVTSLTVDTGASVANQLATKGEVNAKDVVIDVAAAQTIGKVGSKKVETNAKSSPEGKVLSNAADRKQRIANNRSNAAQNGSRSRPSQQFKANQAKNKLDAHGKTRAAAAGTASSGAASKIIQKATSQGGGGREIEHGEIKYPKGILK